MMEILLIALAGGFGATLRFVITKKMENINNQYIPYATFLINVLGSFIIGIVYGITESFFAVIISVGFLGGFTTYSTFMYESLQLMQKGKLLRSLLYSFSSFALGIGFVFVGGIVGQAFVELVK
jgi:fluoride exporter